MYILGDWMSFILAEETHHHGHIGGWVLDLVSEPCGANNVGVVTTTPTYTNQTHLILVKPK